VKWNKKITFLQITLGVQINVQAGKICEKYKCFFKIFVEEMVVRGALLIDGTV